MLPLFYFEMSSTAIDWSLKREDEYRNFFICMVQLESCWRTPPLENGREDKSQLRGNKCQKFCQEIHFVFQLYKCLTYHELTIYYYTPKFFKNKCSLMMLRTLWIMYSAKLSLTCPCKEVRHASFYHNFPFKVNECLVYVESLDNKLLSLHYTVKIVYNTWKKCVLAIHFTNLKSLKQFSSIFMQNRETHQKANYAFERILG